MRTEDICIDIPKGIFFEGPGSKTLESVDIKCEDGNAGYISGKGDAFLKLDDGSYAVIDFKTTAMSSDKARDYSTQLHAYKYALENNREGKPHLSPITKLGIIVFEPYRYPYSYPQPRSYVLQSLVNRSLLSYRNYSQCLYYYNYLKMRKKNLGPTPPKKESVIFAPVISSNF